ncbi:aminotransferase class I/II-fold pyridoxal phosphate-dependent enzyme [Lawsonella clevelandensis]|uniref:aminotransferase class I/II-fold pyridoxal phosphate-dependent enzyme n=1 Tax=Lawsonella clevelandensis TaxID=1528099 RepID=UPI002906D403|nr:aminotransferase class I/II-fold pyridoxal phosphate-dependent enzyme [Lawsonella clevelandensis]MDU7193451.1 aminotransferase class I/II-fold pyridoxal phosphate-dependent enzyme [Lawsonella clevelandensis]
MSLSTMSREELEALSQEINARYEEFKGKNLALDLTRGKPSVQQLDLSNGLLTLPGEGSTKDEDGTDIRNYGNLAGLKSIRAIWAELLGVPVEEIISENNASLEIMHYVLTFAMLHGLPTSLQPWVKEETLKWICPVPGYDRHFAITETLGFEMIQVPMNEDGPDADAIAELVANDPAIKGMWLVPVFANPDGAVTSREVAQKLVSMKTAAPDFTIMWDNAYCIHTLTDEFPEILPIVQMAADAGNEGRVFQLTSSSKVTFAGAGVSFLNTSPANLAWYQKYLGIATIGPNKVNQLAHACFFGDAAAVKAHMLKHKDILAPKFDAVEKILADRLGGYEVASWTEPKGGYFISLDVVPGTAKRVVALAAEAGIKLTGAGSAYPKGEDPNETNIRLAPSLPPLEEVTVAMDGVATCVLKAALEKALAA